MLKRFGTAATVRINLFLTAAIAFAFGLGLASALDLTPASLATDYHPPLRWLTSADAAPGGPAVVAGEMAQDGASSAPASTDFVDVARRVAPGVVTISVEAEAEFDGFDGLPFGFPFRRDNEEQEEDSRPQLRRWGGSGFVISEDGYVVTNNHVVNPSFRFDAASRSISVTLSDGRLFEDVEIVGADRQTDVALLRVSGGEFTPLAVGSSEGTEVGEWVLAIGSPGLELGFFGPRRTLDTTVTAGIVSAKGRGIGILSNSSNPFAIEDFIQTDAVINRGNSGGPLVNSAGEVIGVNTAILSDDGNFQGYGFAVPIELVRDVVDDLIEFGQVNRALIGVSIRDVTAADAQFYGLDAVEGAVVVSFADDGSPAEEAGVEAGDVIVGVEGASVSGVSELQRRIRSRAPGELVRLDIVRRATRLPDAARVELAAAGTEEAPSRRIEAPRAAQRPSGDILGVVDVLAVDDIPRSRARDWNLAGQDGAVIVEADLTGPLARSLSNVGAEPGGWIVRDVNGAPVTNAEEYELVVSGLEPGQAVNLILERPSDGRGQTIRLVQSLILPRR